MFVPKFEAFLDVWTSYLVGTATENEERIVWLSGFAHVGIVGRRGAWRQATKISRPKEFLHLFLTRVTSQLEEITYTVCHAASVIAKKATFRHS